ncbi:MAG: phenylalanine 4-monooxygenase, partial [Propionibacteriaceae bacterium]|nr:phenylalanine 4-monooxygenase [Propionibacteriaceae bacterium]
MSTVAEHRPAAYDVSLPADHPGASDPAYRARRDAIARVGAAHVPGTPIADVTYMPEEHAVWAGVQAELGELHRTRACRAYLRGAHALVLPTDRVPQLREVDERVHALTGFHIDPVPGLVDTRTFYGALADRRFLSTQYVRHHSVPHYTPEPDIIHEIIGHANMLADPELADLYQAAGEASRRAESDDALQFFSRIFWFTLEFGVVNEDGQPKAFGAGILSSFGELHSYADPALVTHRPFDLVAMGSMAYDITRYQPVLFRAESTARLLDDLHRFFATYDD